MMLFKLGVNNIKRSIKDYAIYFITLILGVSIFYIFNSIDSQTAMLNLSKNSSHMVEMIMTLIGGVSIFISIVLGFLIVYASRFLIKKRKQEFGTYLILGMSKRKISKLLLVETFLLGIISLAVGLLIGVFASQITSLFIARLFEADMERFAFNFSLSAAIKTICYFGIIYLVVMIFNTIEIRRCKLISLLNAKKRNEKIYLKKSSICLVVFVISCVLLGFAYYMVTDGFYDIFADKSITFLLVPILMGGVGTVLFFWSISGLFVKVVSKFKNNFFKKLNAFLYKEISSGINTMVFSISIISIMLFMTICTLSSALSIKDYFNNSIRKYAPADIEVAVQTKDEIDFAKIFEEENVLQNIDEYVSFKMYFDDDFDYGTSLGDYYETMKAKYPFVDYQARVYLMSETDYKEVSKILNNEPIELEENKFAIINNYETDIYNEVLKSNPKIKIFGEEIESQYNEVIDGDYYLNAGASNIGFFVLPDKYFEEKETNYKAVIVKYNVEEKIKQIELNEKISDIDYSEHLMGMQTTNKIEIKENSTGLSAMATFIGIYIGVIFLVSSAAVIALKSLSDAIDNKGKYEILRKIGADEKDIEKTLFKQNLIFFLLPMSLAVVHTIFGLRFCKLVLYSIGITDVFKQVSVTIILMVIIYGIYLLATYLCAKNIIKNN